MSIKFTTVNISDVFAVGNTLSASFYVKAKGEHEEEWEKFKNFTKEEAIKFIQINLGNEKIFNRFLKNEKKWIEKVDSSWKNYDFNKFNDLDFLKKKDTTELRKIALMFNVIFAEDNIKKIKEQITKEFVSINSQMDTINSLNI